jgi:transposase
MKDGTTAVFLDESGYSLMPFITHTWALEGTYPDTYHSGGGWQKLSAISGVAVDFRDEELNTNVFYRTYPGQTITQKEVVAFLRQVSNQIDGDVIFIMDNLRSHRSRYVKKFVEKRDDMDIEFLPPYSPDMNPDEGVWNWSKCKDLVNVCSMNAKMMLKNVRGSLRRLKFRKNVHRWCLNESILDFNSLYKLCGGV